jgi:putative component of toxin-antitoxin plasmid stabilization module
MDGDGIWRRQFFVGTIRFYFVNKNDIIITIILCLGKKLEYKINKKKIKIIKKK